MFDPATETAPSGGASARAAMVLWVIVLIALAYGIFNTGVSVVDLFTG